MASGETTYTEKKMLDHRYGAVTYTPPATVYVGLLTDTNTKAQRDAGTVTEVSTANWTNYARVAKTNNTTNFPAATGGSPSSKANGTDVDYGTAATTANVTCNAFGIWDAPTGGNLLDWGDFSTPAPIVQNTNPVKFPAGSLTLTRD
jgi:hypothetical protein